MLQSLFTDGATDILCAALWRSTAAVMFAAPGLASATTQLTPHPIINDLNTPSAIAIDGSGNVYVALENAFALRIYTPTSTGAYIGQPSIHNPGFKHTLDGVGVDGVGNIYVFDSYMGSVREYAHFPEGLGEIGGFHHDQPVFSQTATGMAVTPEGEVFIADARGVHHYSPSWAGFALLADVTTLRSRKVTVDGAGNVYIAVVGSVLRFAPSGSGYATPQTVATIDTNSIAVDGLGDVYALDEPNRMVRKYIAASAYAEGTPVADAAQLQQPTTLGADAAGDVYVADAAGRTIKKFEPTSARYTRTSDVASDGGNLYLPAGLAVDANGNLFVADQGPGYWGAVHKYAATNQGYVWVGDVVPYGLYTPWGVAVDSAGNVYVSEIYSKGLHKYAPVGDGYVLAADIANDSLFSGVAVDAAGIVYVGDYSNAAIRRYAPAGSGYTRLSDVMNSQTGRWMGQPNALTLDATGNIYYTALDMGQLFRFSPSSSGFVLTGTFSTTSSTVAVDKSGTVYIAEQELRVATFGTEPWTSGTDWPTSLRFWQINVAGMTTDSAGNLYISDDADSRIIKAASTPNLNQHGITGSWYNPATGGQGLEIELYPDFGEAGKGLLFGGWFTYDATAPGGQRWYAIGGAVSNIDGAVDLGIYAGFGGNFSAGPAIPPTQVGTATLALNDCTTGTLSYRFDNDRMGSMPLTRLTANTTCATLGDNGNAPSTYLLSGSWFDVRFAGQGLIIDANPAQKVFFAAWYTYAPNGEAIGGLQSERWYVMQAEFLPGATTLTDVPIYTDSGGVFDDPTPPTPAAVGTANIAFHSCSSATFAYSFTAGVNRGLNGTLELTRTGPAPAGCQL